MEYTEEQLKAAAARAYQDGNVEAAQRLIAQARAASGAQQPAPATPEPIVGKLSSGAASSLQPTPAAIPQEITQMLEADKVARATGQNTPLETGQNTPLDTDPNLRFSWDRPSQAGAFGVGVANGGLLGFSDNIGGFGAAVLGNNRQGEFFDYSGSFRDRYEAGRDRSRLKLDSARAEHPWTTLGGELAGGITTGVAAMPRTVGANALGTMGRTAGVGALEGGVYGAGNADGENVAGNAALGAALGGGIGVAAQPVIQGARALGRTVATPVAGTFNAMTGRASPTRANAIAERAVTRSGMSMDDIQRQAVEAGRAGQPMVLADILGQPGQGAMSGVARTPGAAARELTDFLESRQLNAGDRMSAALSDGLGASDTAAQRRAALTADRTDTARTNYENAREGAGPVDVRGALGVIDSRLGQTSDAAGTGFQGDSIDGAFSQLRNRLAADRVPGDIDAMELSDFSRVLGVKQDIGDAIEAATRAGQGNKARELGNVQREIDAALEAASPGYRQANDQFAAQSRTIEAVDQGANAARPSIRAADSIDNFSAMNTDQQAAFRAGLGDSLIGKVENQAPGANVALPLMKDRTATLLDEVATNPATLRAQIGRENTMAQTRQAAIGGSKTSDNLANMGDVQGVDVGMLANLMRGQFGQAAQQGAQKVSNAATNQTEGTNQLLARILMSDNPQEALAPMLAQQMRRGTRQSGGNAAARTLGNQSVSQDQRQQLLERILGTTP